MICCSSCMRRGDSLSVPAGDPSHLTPWWIASGTNCRQIAWPCDLWRHFRPSRSAIIFLYWFLLMQSLYWKLQENFELYDWYVNCTQSSRLPAKPQQTSFLLFTHKRGLCPTWRRLAAPCALLAERVFVWPGRPKQLKIESCPQHYARTRRLSPSSVHWLVRRR